MNCYHQETGMSASEFQQICGALVKRYPAERFDRCVHELPNGHWLMLVNIFGTKHMFGAGTDVDEIAAWIEQDMVDELNLAAAEMLRQHEMRSRP